MATIGFDKLYTATVTEDENGVETYGTPEVIAKGISADISVEADSADLYADDGVDEHFEEFKKGTLTLGVNDISSAAAAKLFGVIVDSKGVVVSAAESSAPAVAVGFRARKANGKYRYFWLYKVKFSVPGTKLATKGETIAFTTPELTGTIMRRNKPDARGKHPWKAEITEGETGADASTVTNWFSTVYEPAYSGQ